MGKKVISKQAKTPKKKVAKEPKKKVAKKVSQQVIAPKNEQPQTRELQRKDKVIIMGFAPDSRELAPIHDDSFDVWGLNELYMEMPQIRERAHMWFQLHGYEPPTIRDKNQVQSLAALKCPVWMWKPHAGIPNSVQYPLEQILTKFDTYGEGMAPDIPNQRDRAYFTNTVSWMIALAVMFDYKEIHIYGVNMAQDQEFQHQRPSCEFFIAWARGAGKKIYLPIESDLCRSWMLYGYDDGSAFGKKMAARQKELQMRINGIRQQRINAQNQAQNMLNQEYQLTGALENSKYCESMGAPTSERSVNAPEEATDAVSS